MSDLDTYQTPEGYGDTVGRCLTFAEINALLAAEREQCAAVAENFNLDCTWLNEEAICESVASAIRALPPADPTPSPSPSGMGGARGG